MKVILLICIVVALSISDSLSLKLDRGRPRRKHGMVGLPADGPDPEELPKAQWYSQKLDHFDPSNTKRWKQVGSFD